MTVASSEMPQVRGLPGLPRCRVFGIVNVTPDSFSDGGAYLDRDRAVRHGLALLAEGADVLDVGGESTRPGAVRVDADEEKRRVVPVIRDLAAAGAVVSVDTTRASVAEAALEAGARIVNDVSGGAADPGLPRLVAESGVPYVVMHSRGPSDVMQAMASYPDVVSDVVRELGERLDAVVAAGVEVTQVVLDPGIGFAKTAEHNWKLLAHLGALRVLGRPLLVGVSRKSFLGALLDDREPTDRDSATAALTTLLATDGAWAVRVHDVRPNADAVRVVAALQAAGR